MLPLSQQYLIDPHEAEFIKYEIECGNNSRAKRALQLLCRHYRRGGHLHINIIRGTENAVRGALSNGQSDEKVRRWGFSALSNFGNSASCWGITLDALEKHRNEPQVVSAAIATLFKLNPGRALAEISKSSVLTPEFLHISALQVVPRQRLPDMPITIDIEKADCVTLRLALVLVGLNKAPPNLFHPTYNNSELVRALGRYDLDDLVRQYSAWACAENPNLTAKDLGIDLASLDQEPVNIRSYTYRLFAEEATGSSRNTTMIERGRWDEEAEAQLGTALGLRDTYYDGLEEIVLDWVRDERDPDVQIHLVDHICRASDRFEHYQDYACGVFNYETDPTVRRRMLMNASGKRLFKAFKKIEIEEEQGPLAFPTVHINNSNISTLAISGNASNTGTQTNE